MKILFLSRWFPYPPNNGSKLRIYNVLKGLAQKHQVTLLSFAEPSEVPVNTSPLASICPKIQVVPRKPFNPNSMQSRLGFFQLKPRSVIDTFSLEMKRAIEQSLTEKYDIVIASQVDMAAYSQYFDNLPAIFEEAEIGVLYERFIRSVSLPHHFRNGLTWFKHRRYLTSLLKNFQVCTVVSKQEQQLLSQATNGYLNIEVIPNCVDLTNYNDFDEVPQPHTLIFTGSFSYYPNYEAIVWFLRNAFPSILAQVADTRLFITGNHQNRTLPSTNNITLTGFVDDVRPLIARSWASIVPLHTGGGTRLKILEAMALRTPVIATSKGAEGLETEHGKHLLIADTPEAFACEVVHLLKEPDLRQQLTNNAYQLVAEKYNWPVVIPRFLNLVEQVASA